MLVIADKGQFFSLLDEYFNQKKALEDEKKSETDWLDTDAAVTYLNGRGVKFSRQTLFQYVSSGIIRRDKISGRNYFKRDYLDDFILSKSKKNTTVSELENATHEHISKQVHILLNT